MTTCPCGQQAHPGDAWCGGCGRRLDYRAPQQPATVTVAQTLLVLSAVGAALGLLVSAYVVGAVLAVVERMSGLAGPLGGGIGPAAGSGGALTGALGVAVVETIVVVAVSIWAFRAVGAGRAVARHVLALVAGVEALLTIATLAQAGAPAALVVGGVLAGLLVLDAPVLILLWAPAASRAWFAGTPAEPAATSMPVSPATPAQNWAPPLPGPRSAPSGSFPRVPDRHAEDGDPATENLALPVTLTKTGRHAAPHA